MTKGDQTYLWHLGTEVRLPPPDHGAYDIQMEDDGVALLKDGDGLVPCERIMQKLLAKTVESAGERIENTNNLCALMFVFCSAIH